MGYLDTTHEFYRHAAEIPETGLCCTTRASWVLPGLEVTDRMKAMNYGCGSTVHPGDLVGAPTVLYVGVGGGMELLQFAYFCRRPGAVIGVDPVVEMREAARENLAEAMAKNRWLREEFIELREGEAFDLGVDDASIDVAAQNCLFNIFEVEDLRQALAETYRALRPHGRFVLSDPVAPGPLPAHLREDDRLRAMCLSGAITYERYMQLLVEAGFGTIEVRARRPYRVLDPDRYQLEEPVLLESIEVAAIKDPIPSDGPCIFTGRTAVYYGKEESYDDGAGHVLPRDIPLSVCDKTATTLLALSREDILITPSTWFYNGGGCC